jgi:hypothetical protein
VAKKASFESQFSYRYNNRSPVSFNRSVYLWNLSANMKLFKNNKGQLRISANDILKSNRDINRIVGANFIEDVQTTRIRNYYSINFTYNWSSVEKNK